MTAEVLVMNRLGVSLAADSAVTIGDKVFSSVDKLFQLSESRPIGIMIYGTASLLGVPWETIIKAYRRSFAGKEFSTVAEYSKHFLEYLQKAIFLFTDSVQDSYVREVSQAACNYILSQLQAELMKTFINMQQVEVDRVKEQFENIVSTLKEKVENAKKCSAIPDKFDQILYEKYSNSIDASVQSALQNLPRSEEATTMIRQIVVNGICSAAWHAPFQGAQWFSGIVCAGFGESEYYPSYTHHQVKAVLAGELIYDEQRGRCIEGGDGLSSCVEAFAQSEMVQTFLYGIDPYMDLLYHGSTIELLNHFAKDIVDVVKAREPEFGDELDKAVAKLQADLPSRLKESLFNQNFRYSDSIFAMVKALPKDELGLMAEALVNLTKFKRRVSNQQETVGGPIDVAVITKGDGFVWIKRKHYFPAELNPRIMARYKHE